MNKDQLSKLASLNNTKTNKFLEEFAMQERLKIVNSKTNEEIIEHLELLNAIYYRVPKIIAWVINYLIYKAKPIDAVIRKTSYGKFSGQTSNDVLVKCLEMARNIRYYEVEKCIQISFDYIDSSDKNISGLAIKLIEEIVEYNHNALPKIGLIPQLASLHFLEGKLKSRTSQEKNTSFIKIVIQHILETSSSITTMTSPDTLTMSHGDIPGHKNVAKMRREAINFIWRVFEESKSVKVKSEIFFLFEQACRMPMNSSRESALGQIIQKDRIYLAKKLSAHIFDGKVIVQPLFICMRVEQLMYWFFIHIELQEKIGQTFIKRLYANDRYKLFSKFVHDDSYRYAKNKIEEVVKDTKEDIKTYVAEIEDKNKNKILSQLEDIAHEAINADEWKFLSFKNLLEYMGQEKPDLTFYFTEQSISKNYELSNNYFLPFLLAGLRRAERFDLWDKLATIILKEKRDQIMFSLIASMYMSYSNEVDIIVRKDEDVNLLNNLISRKGPFDFYKENSNILNYFTIHALRVAYPVDPKKIEEMTVNELNNHPDYFSAYLHNISIYSMKGEGFCLNDWSTKNKKFLMQGIVKLPDLDWNAQMILPLISSPEGIIDLFIKRMKLRDKLLPEKDEDYFTSPNRNYDPVPYHMNHELIEYIGTSTNIVDLISKNLSTKYNSHSFELSQLIKNLGINPVDISKELSKKEKNTDARLKKIVESLSSFDHNDPDFLIELASQTSNKSIHLSLYGKLSATGVVSGEFGIADAYKHKREAIEKYKDSEDKNIQQFLSIAIDSLKKNEEHQRKQAELEKEIRRIDFESNN